MKNEKAKLDKFRQKEVNKMIGNKLYELRVKIGFKKRGDFLMELDKYDVYITEETYRSCCVPDGALGYINNKKILLPQ